MALDEEHSGSAQEMRRPIDWLRDCRALAGVDAMSLEALAADAVHFSLPAGAQLFEAGSAPDGIYVVVAGRLAVKPPGGPPWTAQIGPGELVGELSWLLAETRGYEVAALRDSELLWLAAPIVDAAAAKSPLFALALARLSARRLHQTNRRLWPVGGARVIAIVPNGRDADVPRFASRLVAELARSGRAELVSDVRASSHTTYWFDQIEEANDYVVYLADPVASAWTHQCCRQADLLLLAGDARNAPQPWPEPIRATASRPGATVELALLHSAGFVPGAAARWLAATAARAHHHIIDASDIGRVARLLTGRGVGLVLSGGGARGFAHLGVIHALREAGVAIDCVGGVSIGAIIAAGVALGWSDQEMHIRYQRSFVDSNPVNDYTFPLVALTRGRKVSRLLRQEFGEIAVEDLRLPFFCASANLTTGRIFEHRHGPVWLALRASVAIPGVMPPVFSGEQVLVDGAAINNLPIDLMKNRAPGLIIGSDTGAESAFTADCDASGQPPLWKFFAKTKHGKRRLNIFQILMRAGIVGSALGEAAQRALADVILKPPLENIDLLNWRAFEHAIDAGYEHTRKALQALPTLPRLAAVGAAADHDAVPEAIPKRALARAG